MRLGKKAASLVWVGFAGLWPHLHHTMAPADHRDKLGHLWQQPGAKDGVGRVADTQPNDERTGRAGVSTLGKILVFGEDDPALRVGVPPDRPVICFAQTDFTHGFRVITRLPQPLREGRRQLSID